MEGWAACWALVQVVEAVQAAQLGLGKLKAFRGPAIVAQLWVLLQNSHTRGQALDPLLLGVAFRAGFSNIDFAMIAMYDVGTVIRDEYNVGSSESVPRNTYSLS